jgi:regulatory protein
MEAPLPDAEATWNLATRYLGQREASEKTLKRYLVRKGCESGAIQSTLEKLVRLGWVDDRRWARIAIRDSIRSRRGPHHAKRRLQAKGVRLTDSEFQELWDTEAQNLEADPVTEACAWAERRFRSRDLSDRRERMKLMQAVVRRGFSLDVARAVADRLGKRTSLQEDEEGISD